MRAGRRLPRVFVSGLLMALGAGVMSASAKPPEVEWTRQFGTAEIDRAHAVAVAPDGSVYVAGSTLGELQDGGGSTSDAFKFDAFLRKYDVDGNVVWTRQFGTDNIDEALAVAMGPDGSVYVAGYIDAVPSSLDLTSDAFVHRYDADGNVVWARQFGTDGEERDLIQAVAVGPDGSVYVTGRVADRLPDVPIGEGPKDFFVRKYDADGDVEWTDQLAHSLDSEGFGVAVGADGSVHVVGSNGALAFVFTYAAEGHGLWSTSIETDNVDIATAVAVGPEGHVHVVGVTGGELSDGGGSAGGSDAFIRTYDPGGDVVWTRQFGTAAGDAATAVVAVAPGSQVHVAGRTGGALPDWGGSAGGDDAFVRTYDSGGDVVWTRQFGTAANDSALAVAVGPDGQVHVAGSTGGALPDGGGSAGSQDAFVLKLAQPPTVGLFDPSQGQWHLRNSTGAVTSFYFGNPGDYPIMGDWDCDGVDTPGMYRQSDGFVYLRNTNTQGVADIRFFFGNPGDVPIAGDFNNNNCDTVSIYRPSNQTFYIINALGANDGGLGAADFSYVFGNPGDKPFVGDFNGNGTDTVGLHREATGFVYFRNTHTQGNADNQFFFGDPNDRFITGDWNANGTDTPAIFRPGNTTFYFRYTNTQGNADAQFVWGQSGWLPVSGFFGLG